MSSQPTLTADGIQEVHNNPGTYDVTHITTNALGNDMLLLTNFITVYPTPLPVISVSGNTLTSSAASSYRWLLNTVVIPGATDGSYVVTQSGVYTILIPDENGCNSYADYIFTGNENLTGDGNLLIYPNPSSGVFSVEIVMNAAAA
ncbi:MAG: hypothetical protein ABIO46_05275 [Chitinophagales bacterium]